MEQVSTDADTPILDVTGVILAGGRGSRMERDKATLDFGGRPLLSRVAGRLRLVFERTVVIGPTTLAPLASDAEVVPDTHPHRGPLGGLATALERIGTPWICLVGCDMPFIQPALLRVMSSLALATSSAQAVALRGQRGLEPLHALYRHEISPIVAETLAGPNPSMRALLDRLSVAEVAPDDVARLDPTRLSTFNINRREDLEKALALAAGEGDDEN
ncbi:MAG TPA: molybdenum cofactor guanylyltransferase [Ktedonobacterales bacterium]